KLETVEKDDQKPRSKFGRRFDEEFKRDAVRMLESRVRTAEQLAGELGVSVWSLKRWAQIYGQHSAAGGLPGGAARQWRTRRHCYWKMRACGGNWKRLAGNATS